MKMAGESVAERLQNLNSRVLETCRRSGRAPESVRVLAVSKAQSLAKIRSAYDSGQREFAENYAQEAVEKLEQLANLPVQWHFIGRIQSNKVKFLAGRFWAIHSVDRYSIAQALDKQCEALGRVQNIFLQFNVAGEATKGGAAEADLENLFNALLGFAHLRVLGLMVMPPLELEPEAARGCFALARRKLEELRAGLSADALRQHPCAELSMGTSHDFEQAIEEGATWIRVGSEIFGPRVEVGI
jgi:pyridoxal phosphate enzyme (YggS family)